MDSSTSQACQQQKRRRRRQPYHHPSIVRVVCVLILLLLRVTSFRATAWRFRWRRRGLVGDGLPQHRKNNHQSNNNNSESPFSSPKVELQQKDHQQQWFSWSVASAAAELAESTMEEAVGVWHEVWDQYLTPSVAVRSAIGRALQHCKAFLLYQPPVGLVTAWVVSRLVLTGRLFRRRNIAFSDDDTVEGELLLLGSSDTKNERLRGRSLLLDGDDQSYTTYGGIERIRQRLCLAAMQGLWLWHQRQPLPHQPNEKENRRCGLFVVLARFVSFCFALLSVVKVK